MSYKVLATSQTPALIIYVLDVSGSMSDGMDGRRRIDVVTDALYAALQEMVFRSTKGGRVSPRYRVAVYAYSNDVYDILGGIKPIDQVAQMGVPELETMRATDTARAFEQVEQLLHHELPHIGNCPAPLVCHMTDGEYTGANPEAVVRRIMSLQNPDGNVLVENIFISDDILKEPVKMASAWPGITPSTSLASDYAKALRNISSPLPPSYRTVMVERGYEISPDAVMMLPGNNPDLVEMGFAMSMSTPISEER